MIFYRLNMFLYHYGKTRCICLARKSKKYIICDNIYVKTLVELQKNILMWGHEFMSKLN